MTSNFLCSSFFFLLGKILFPTTYIKILLCSKKWLAKFFLNSRRLTKALFIIHVVTLFFLFSKQIRQSREIEIYHFCSWWVRMRSYMASGFPFCWREVFVWDNHLDLKLISDFKWLYDITYRGWLIGLYLTFNFIYF